MWTLQSPPKLPLFFNAKENWPNKVENEAISSEMSDSYPVLIYEKNAKFERGLGSSQV